MTSILPPPGFRKHTDLDYYSFEEIQSKIHELIHINNFDLNEWIPVIRKFVGKEPLYMVIYECSKNGHLTLYANLFRSIHINWMGKNKNNYELRGIFFHRSKFDPNIWIIKKEGRTNLEIIKSILTKEGFGKLKIE